MGFRAPFSFKLFEEDEEEMVAGISDSDRVRPASATLVFDCVRGLDLCFASNSSCASLKSGTTVVSRADNFTTSDTDGKRSSTICSRSWSAFRDSSRLNCVLPFSISERRSASAWRTASASRFGLELQAPID